MRRTILAIYATLMIAATSATSRENAIYRTANFTVMAATNELAKQIGDAAEQQRKKRACEWLGKEIPQWPVPCNLTVTVMLGTKIAGQTRFQYDFRGGYQTCQMDISGSVERMLNNVLPHEITHTVFAHYFRYPVPRWADEGGSVYSESDQERNGHQVMCRKYEAEGKLLPLRRLFAVKEYNELPDPNVLYAQGYAVTNYIITKGGRKAFLGFVGTGMRGNWDEAANTWLQFKTVDDLEADWLKSLRAMERPSVRVSAPNWASETNLVGRRHLLDLSPGFTAISFLMIR